MKDRFEVLDANTTIPWVVIAPHEGQAICNHGQDLETLNKRGGLTWSEMIAVLEDRRWSRMDENTARKKVEEFVRKMCVL